MNTLRKSVHGGTYLEHVPEELRTEELCMAAMRQNRHILQYVINKTEEMYLPAVESNPHSLVFIPKQFQTDEILSIGKK